MTKSYNLFAEKREDGSFNNVYPREGQVKMCGVPEELIVSVVVTEDVDGIYHGWVDKDGLATCMVWPSLMQLKVCFPYGMEAAIEAGQGVYVKLKIEELSDD